MKNNLKSNILILNYSIFIFFKILIPSIALSTLIILLIEANNIQDHVYLPKKSNINFISALFVAPIVETIILSILIKMLQKSNKLKTKLPTTIGIIAAVTHGMQNFVSILSAGWSFYMYTIFFIELEKNIGIKKSFKYSIFLHLAINMAAIAFLKLSLKISGA